MKVFKCVNKYFKKVRIREDPPPQSMTVTQLFCFFVHMASLSKAFFAKP